MNSNDLTRILQYLEVRTLGSVLKKCVNEVVILRNESKPSVMKTRKHPL
jgi:hypothetical protein